MTTLKQRLDGLASVEVTPAIKNIQRGIERETLRVTPKGKISQQPHPKLLGAALTHPYITTDYSEALLELITPPSNNIDETYSQLQDIHHFVVKNIGDEVLWPMSMPCFIEHQDEIPIAYFGESNVGKMKRTYRKGLKNRYGSMMQAIAGIHYNFSLPPEFWSVYQKSLGDNSDLTTFQSEQYMRMVRNIKRHVWLITYLFGASPAMCRSFLEGNDDVMPFESLGKGTVYLPHATSLRMSDLGYTNSAQSSLNVEYGDLQNYIAKLRQAIRTKSEEYQEIGVKIGTDYQQLNDNILQIENELYAPVRPKQIARSGEKPTDALERRGIMYVELRALDVNPFSPYGITKEQMRVLDLFMLFCLFSERDELSPEQQNEADENIDRIVLNGRAEELLLKLDGEDVDRNEWVAEIFAEMKVLADWLDGHYGGMHYAIALNRVLPCQDNPNKTLSGLLLNELIKSDKDNGIYSLELADAYKTQISTTPATHFKASFLIEEGQKSLAKQKQIEAADTLSFDEFLKDYFKY